MTQRIYAILMAVAMFVVAGSLAGCGSSASNSASIEQNQVAKATVTIAAKFPTADGAVKSLIPATAEVIQVYAQNQSITFTNYSTSTPNHYGSIVATLTRALPSATVQITPGMYMVYAIAFDAAGKQVGITSTGGEVKSGQSNTIILTFMDGQWTLVNTSDTATPLVLSDGTQLNDFIVNAEMYLQEPAYKAGKSSIDYSKPVGGGGGVVRLRFNNNTSARTYGGMVSQFIGASNSTLLGSKGYNLTQKCGFAEHLGIPCDETAGDQIVMMGNEDNIADQSGNFYESSILVGSAETLLPGSGQTTVTQDGTALDLMAAIPATVVTGGTVITGGIIEWKPSSGRILTLGPPPAAKVAKSAKAVKAQSTSTSYANITVKDYEIIVCSVANPENTGTWSFASTPDSGKVLIGGRTCYTNDPSLGSQYNPANNQYIVDAGDYSYGLVPTDTGNLGDYCHQWDYAQYIYGSTEIVPNPNYNTCKQQMPGTGDVYNPHNFKAVRSATKTAISYGSFKLNFWGETSQNGTAHIYPFRAKGSTTVTPAQ